MNVKRGAIVEVRALRDGSLEEREPWAGEGL